MEFLTVIFVIFTCLSTTILAVILYLIYKNQVQLNMILKKESPTENPVEHKRVSTTTCVNHPDNRAKGSCSIWESYYCELCLRQKVNIPVCSDHLSIVTDNKWIPVKTIYSTPDNPENGLEFHDLKRFHWKENQIPSYIETQYKINLDNEAIESFITLYTTEKHLSLFTKKSTDKNA